MVIIGLTRTQKFNFYLTLDRGLIILKYLLRQVLIKWLIKFNLVFIKTWNGVIILGKETVMFREDD